MFQIMFQNKQIILKRVDLVLSKKSKGGKVTKEVVRIKIIKY